MKFTLAWLKDHLDTDADLETIARTLTALGLEVESVTDRAQALAPFTVAHVVAAEPHPDADKLRVCTVDTGAGRVQVVCGAPNARTGMKGVFAAAGTTISGSGLHLKKTKIRGVESNGMLCSEYELGLGDDHDGIIELADGAAVGTPYAAAADLDDPLIDIAVTPNRQDCLGVRGIARDLAAAGLGDLRPNSVDAVPGGFPNPVDVRLDFVASAAEACPMFAGRAIRGVNNAESPEWLKTRLHAIGLRPISALVDITNFVTYDRGRPLHVFDADKIAGGVTVRLSRAGESLAALDGRDYTLDDSMTVIADDRGALALGGIIGGEPSGCTADTRTVFMESALFDPVRTAQSGRRLGIESDARYRFERGVDPESAVPGIELATKLVLECCGGEPGEIVVAGGPPAWRREIPLRAARLKALGGLDVPPPRRRAILEALGFTVAEAGEAMRVAVPSWRSDIDGEADLVEEIVRVHGYDAIPALSLPPREAGRRPAIDPLRRRAAIVRRTLAARGMTEAVTFSFASRRDAALFGGGGPELDLSNPLSAAQDCMRPTPLPNLIAACGRNIDRGIADLALFEVGPSYCDPTPAGQRMVAAGVRRGRTGPRHWLAEARPVDAFDAKADCLAALEAAGAPTPKAQLETPAPAWYHPGRSAALKLGPKTVLGHFGEVHPRVLEALDVAGPLVAFEVFLDAVPRPKAKPSRSRPRLQVSEFQTVARDFAFVVEAAMPASVLVQAARGAEKRLIAAVAVFDVYAGEGGAAVPEGKKSIAITAHIEPADRTLTEAEIQTVSDKIVAAVAQATGGTLRS